jgi:hypothetical protein
MAATPTNEHDHPSDELVDITDRLRAESKTVHDEFAQLNGARHEAWERHAAEIRITLDDMQRDLDEARSRLELEHQRTQEEAQDDLDELFATLHGRYDELRLQVRLGAMGASDQVEALREEAGRILDRGRSAVRRARAALRNLVP